MSSGASATPDLVFKISKCVVQNELLPPTEVATAPDGIVTESFGPTQVTLNKAHVRGHLDHNTAYEIKAGTPHNFLVKNMHYVATLPGDTLLFRAPIPKAS